MAQKDAKKEGTGWEQGRSLAVTAVGAFLAVVTGFFVYQLIPLYYYYFDLQNHMRRVIPTAAVETDEEIRRSLMAVIKRHGISCGDRDLQVSRGDGTMEISLRYSETVRVGLFGKELPLFSLNFDASAKGSVR